MCGYIDYRMVKVSFEEFEEHRERFADEHVRGVPVLWCYEPTGKVLTWPELERGELIFDGRTRSVRKSHPALVGEGD